MGTEPGNEAYWRTRVGMLRAAAKDKGPCEGAMLMAGTLAEIADVLEAGLDRAPTDSHIARALALLDRVGDAAADALIKGEAAVTTWQPIETAPFRDTYAIVLWHGGHVSYEDLDHDSDAAWWRERGATHWALMPPPLAAGRLDKENDDA